MCALSADLLLFTLSSGALNAFSNGRSPTPSSFQRRRYNFGARCVFNDREYDAPVADFRPRREPAYELKRAELTVALQVRRGGSCSIVCTPTPRPHLLACPAYSYTNAFL